MLACFSKNMLPWDESWDWSIKFYLNGMSSCTAIPWQFYCGKCQADLYLKFRCLDQVSSPVGKKKCPFYLQGYRAYILAYRKVGFLHVSFAGPCNFYCSTWRDPLLWWWLDGSLCFIHMKLPCKKDVSTWAVIKSAVDYTTKLHRDNNKL